MSTEMFNVRLEAEMVDAIEAAAKAAGLRKSPWAREVLAVVALGGVSLEDLRTLLDERGVTGGVSPHPVRNLMLQGQTGRKDQAVSGCLHPPTAITKMPFTDVCSLCGATVRKR